MRKAQKKQLFDFLKLLEKAHEEIKLAIQKNNIMTVLEILKSCQRGAITAGELVEKSEGEDSLVIHEIESYCELVYQIYEELIQDQDVDENRIDRMLGDAFTKMEEKIRNNIKIKNEVVFLPYKAAMWDSLESVWKAANEDPDWETYVVPIPYYDIGEDGKIGDIHYEADLFPEYVSVLHYEKYNFEYRRPDMIFIHNPYDDSNYMTSVPPFFYTKNLKKFTEQLIYIPYYVLNEIDLNDEESVKEIEHFCIIPGVLNTDKIIVQSESMREVYINNLIAHTGEYSRIYWEERVLGLGSPKMDKAISTKKEDVDVPEEWRAIIQKSSGKWKKIILYNTGLAALIEHKEKMLHKMQCVFRIFKSYQEEIALLWRPHPLILTAFNSLVPQLRKDYVDIVRNYRNEGWGIYDDSAEFNRALALSDGYYGDHSSLVPLCKEIGLPVMIQNVDAQ